MTTTAAGFELTAMIYAVPPLPDAPTTTRRGAFAIKVAAAGFALWLAATLGVLTGLCSRRFRRRSRALQR